MLDRNGVTISVGSRAEGVTPIDGRHWIGVVLEFDLPDRVVIASQDEWIDGAPEWTVRCYPENITVLDAAAAVVADGGGGERKGE